MEQLADSLIAVLKDSPSLAIWVLAIIYGFKVVVVGSVYGTIKHVVNKLHDVLVNPKRKLVEVDVEASLRGVTIDHCLDALITEVNRIRRGPYIHSDDVRWLREAIDAHEQNQPRKRRFAAGDE